MDYKKIFNDELESVKAKYDKGRRKQEQRESMRASVEQDMDKLIKEYVSIVKDMNKRFNSDVADIKKYVENPEGKSENLSYKSGETIAFIYKDGELVTYELSPNSTVSKDTTIFVIKVKGYLRLPSLLVKVFNDGDYYYYEDGNPFVEAHETKDELIDEPSSKDKTQFEEILKKHIIRMAHHIGKDNYEIV